MSLSSFQSNHISKRGEHRDKSITDSVLCEKPKKVGKPVFKSTKLIAAMKSSIFLSRASDLCSFHQLELWELKSPRIRYVFLNWVTKLLSCQGKSSISSCGGMYEMLLPLLLPFNLCFYHLDQQWKQMPVCKYVWRIISSCV